MSKLVKLVIGLAVALVAVAVAGLMWWILRDEGPAAVDLETAVALVEAPIPDDADDSPASGTGVDGEEAVPATGSTETPTMTSTVVADDGAASTGDPVSADTTSTTAVSESTGDVTTTSSAGSNTTASPSTTTATDDAGTDTTPEEVAGAALAGVWTLMTAEGAGDQSDGGAAGFAGYRVVEVLAGGVDESTVVGRTTDVAGSIELTATALVAVTVQVDMSTLRTDDSHRDSHARKSLNTKEFPLAVFTLTEPVELPVGVAAGDPFTGSARGDLTIKGVTNQAVFDLEAQLVGDTIVVVGSSEVVFGDYGVTAPTSPSVISVEDHGIMEFQLYFVR